MNKPSIYLSGAIEYANDSISWRRYIYDSLKDQYNVIIPEGKSIPYKKTETEYKSWVKDEFIMLDMTLVATSPYFFVRLDPRAFKGSGTVSELTLACWLGKHIVYMIEDMKEEDCPGWTLGCLSNAIRVNNIDEAIEYYRNKEIK